MVRLLGIILLLMGCGRENTTKTELYDNDDIYITLINTWLNQNVYPIDSSLYYSEVVFSNGSSAWESMNLNIIPNSILRDSVSWKADSVKVNNAFLNKNILDTAKHKVQFYFSNFLFDSSKSIAMSNLSILFLSKKNKGWVEGGEERTVIYAKKNDGWVISKEKQYIEY